MTTNKISFPEVFTKSFRSLLSEEVNTCLPGVITEVTDFKKKKVTVQPQIKKKFIDGDEITIEPITNVPLQFFSTPNVILKPPQSELVGANVLIMFSQRSIDNWILKGEIVSPGSNTLFSQNDCFAILGIQSFKEDHAVIEENNDLELIYSDKKISLKENGDIEITANNTITIKNSGDIEIGGSNLRKLVTEDMKLIFNSHVHNFTAAPSGAFSTSPPASLTPTIYPTPGSGGVLAVFGNDIGDHNLTEKVQAQ